MILNNSRYRKQKYRTMSSSAKLNLENEGVHLLGGTWHQGKPRGDRRWIMVTCHENWGRRRACRKCPPPGGIVGLTRRGPRGRALKTNPSGCYLYSCAFINQCEWNKKQSEARKEKHYSRALREKTHFLLLTSNSSSLFK